MKKTLIAAAAAVALTASAAAEITFGSWGRAIAVPLATNGKDTVAGQTMSWGGYGRTTGVDFIGQDDEGKCGFIMSYRVTTNNESSPGDAAHFWVKPLDQVKLTIGKVDHNALRGDLCFGSWNWIRPGFYDDEGLTMSGYGKTGLMAEFTPVEGFYAFVGVPLTNDFSSTNGKAEDVYKKTQIGAAYAIDGVGKIKAQYIGKGKDSTIEAAFDLTAVENLFFTVGLAYNNYDKVVPSSNIMKIGVGASYQVNDDLKVSASAQFKTYDDQDMSMAFGAGVAYGLGDGLTAEADVRVKMENKDAREEQQIAAFAGLTKQVGAASLGIGFQMKTDCPNDKGLQDIKNVEADKKLIWAVPVVLSMAL